MTTITTTPISINEWTDRKGNTRRYINGWLEALYGLEVEYYKTGNINHAYISETDTDQEPGVLTNAGARRLMGAKVWLDSADTIHVDYLDNRGHDGVTADGVRARIAQALNL